MNYIGCLRNAAIIIYLDNLILFYQSYRQLTAYNISQLKQLPISKPPEALPGKGIGNVFSTGNKRGQHETNTYRQKEINKNFHFIMTISTIMTKTILRLYNVHIATYCI